MVKFASYLVLFASMLLLLPAIFFPAMAQESLTDPAVVTPVEKTTTMNAMLDQAVEKLPPLRKRIMKRILSNPERREEVIDLCAVKLAENPKLKGYAATFNAESFDGNTEMGINPDNLKIILDALMKFLPILIQLFFKV